MRLEWQSKWLFEWELRARVHVALYKQKSAKKSKKNTHSDDLEAFGKPREESPVQSTAGLDETEEEDFTALVHKVLERLVTHTLLHRTWAWRSC